MRDMEKQFENNGDWMELHYFLEQLKDFLKSILFTFLEEWQKLMLWSLLYTSRTESKECVHILWMIKHLLNISGCNLVYTYHCSGSHYYIDVWNNSVNFWVNNVKHILKVTPPPLSTYTHTIQLHNSINISFLYNVGQKL